MTKITKAFRRGQISGFLKTHSINATAKEFKCSRNTVRVISEGRTRRTDMDAARAKLKKKRKKSHAALINERRRTVDRLLQQKTKHTEDNQGNVREIPTHPTIKSVRRYFAEKPSRQMKNVNNNKRRGRIPSVSTLRRDAIALNYVNYVRPLAPYRQYQKARRLKFCRNENFQDENYVKRLLLSDEHVITANDYSSRTQWVKVVSAQRRKAAKKKLLTRQRKSKYNVTNHMFWAMIGWNYKSAIIWLEFDDGHGGTTSSMNARRYIDHVLSRVQRKLRGRNVVFMQDGARAHTANITKEWLSENNVTVLDDWPANSPDLNPIEELWAEINRLLSVRGVPKTKQELKQMVEDEWNKIPMEKINKYVMSFMSKTAACVRNQGGESK